MGVLALDLGKFMGWAHVDDGVVSDFGEVPIAPKKSTRGQRFDIMVEELSDLIEVHNPAYLIYERPFCRNLDATRCLWGYAAVVELVAHNSGLASIDELPSTIKKFALGPTKRGQAGKDKMIAAAEKLVCATNLGEHEADAIWLGLYAHANVQIGECYG